MDFKKLTKNEMLHLLEMMEDRVVDMFKLHEEFRNQNGRIEPCWECKHIAAKLKFGGSFHE